MQTGATMDHVQNEAMGIQIGVKRLRLYEL